MGRVIRVVVGVVVALLLLTVVASLVRPPVGRAIGSFLYDWRWWSVVVVAVIAVLSLGPLVGAFLRPASSPWRAHVGAAADSVEHHLSLLPPAADPAKQAATARVSAAVADHLNAARKAVNATDDEHLGLGRQVVDWWTGAKIEAAYVNLHEAETTMSDILPQPEIEVRIPEALARLQTMDVSDPRRRAAEAELNPDRPGPHSRVAFKNAVRIGLQLKDQQHARIRGFRNIVLSSTVGLLSAVLALCVIGAAKPDAIPLCFGPAPTVAAGQAPAPVVGPAGVACPTEESPPTPGTQPRRLPAPGDVALVCLIGMLGGALSATAAIRHLQGTSVPYDVPVALCLLKLPSGSLAAVAGLLLVKGEFVPGLSQLDNQPQILAYAFLFGIAQWLVTRLVDRRAQDILGKMPSKEPTSDKPEPPPIEPAPQPQPQAEPKRGLRLPWRSG